MFPGVGIGRHRLVALFAPVGVLVIAGVLSAQQGDARPVPPRRRERPAAAQRPEPAPPPETAAPRDARHDPDDFEPVERPGMPRQPRPFAEMSDQERAELLQFVRENFPERARELEALADYDPPAFQRRMGRIVPRLWQLIMEMHNDPESGRVGLEIEKREMQVHEHIRQYADTVDPARRNELRAQTRALLQEQFALRRQRMQHEIGKLEQRLQQLRDRVQNAEQHRDRLIDARLANLLSEPPAPHDDLP
jgi:hypothetical protein